MSLTIRNILNDLNSSQLIDSRGQLWFETNFDSGYYAPTEEFFGWDGYPLEVCVLKVGSFIVFIEDGKAVSVIKSDNGNKVDDVLVY